MNKIIVLSGIDSAGKSTQIEKIENYLLEKNKKVTVVWSRGGYTPLFNGLKLLIRKIIPRSIPKPGESEERNQTFSKKYIRMLWLNIALVDMILLYGLYFRILKIFGYTIIADRYLWDTYIDFKLKFNNDNFEQGVLWKTLIHLSPSPNLSFLLTIPIDESLRRSYLKNEPFSENFNQRESRLKLYTELIEKELWDYIIDGLMPIDEVWSNIKNKLE